MIYDPNSALYRGLQLRQRCEFLKHGTGVARSRNHLDIVILNSIVWVRWGGPGSAEYIGR